MSRQVVYRVRLVLDLRLVFDRLEERDVEHNDPVDRETEPHGSNAGAAALDEGAMSTNRTGVTQITSRAVRRRRRRVAVERHDILIAPRPPLSQRRAVVWVRGRIVVQIPIGRRRPV